MVIIKKNLWSTVCLLALLVTLLSGCMVSKNYSSAMMREFSKRLTGEFACVDDFSVSIFPHWLKVVCRMENASYKECVEVLREVTDFLSSEPFVAEYLQKVNYSTVNPTSLPGPKMYLYLQTGNQDYSCEAHYHTVSWNGDIYSGPEYAVDGFKTWSIPITLQYEGLSVVTSSFPTDALSAGIERFPYDYDGDSVDETAILVITETNSSTISFDQLYMLEPAEDGSVAGIKLSNESLLGLLRQRSKIMDHRADDVIYVVVGNAGIRLPREAYAGADGKVDDLGADCELISFSVAKGSMVAMVRVYLHDVTQDKTEPIGEIRVHIEYDRELGFHVSGADVIIQYPRDSDLYPLPRLSA